MDSLADSISWLAFFISGLTAKQNVLNVCDKASDTFLTTTLFFFFNSAALRGFAQISQICNFYKTLNFV